MSANLPSAIGDEPRTEERLRRVTALCVESLILRGLDERAIRRTVLRIAKRVIGTQAIDEYEEETHTAIVQRTIEERLSRSGLVD